MKFLIKISLTMIVFFERRSPVSVDGFDPNIMMGSMGTYFENYFFGVKDVLVGTGRYTSYGWYIFETSFRDKDVAWNAKSAEYFYYSEYKRRTRRYRRWMRKKREADALSQQNNNTHISFWHPVERYNKRRRNKKLKKHTGGTDRKLERARERIGYEFYCTAEMHSKRQALCKWALLNSKVGADFIWVDDSNAAPPVCEYRRVKLTYRAFETEGTFLRCPYRMKNNNNVLAYRYIKAVKNPAEYRLILYWLEEDISPIEQHYQYQNQYPSNAGQNSYPEPTHVSYPNIQETSTAGSGYQQYSLPPHNQPPYGWNSNTNVYQPQTSASQWKPADPGGPNRYVVIDPIKTKGGGNVSIPPTIVQPAQGIPSITPITPLTNVHPAQDLVALNSKPPLKVVYLLLNKRFTQNPRESLFSSDWTP